LPVKGTEVAEVRVTRVENAAGEKVVWDGTLAKEESEAILKYHLDKFCVHNFVLFQNHRI
jgi:hypothetical protein